MTLKTSRCALQPRLVVADPLSALAYYQAALDARTVEHFADDQNRIVHAAFCINDTMVSLTQSVPEWGLLDPHALNGSPCLLHLTVANPDEIAQRMVELGGRLIIPIDDRPYGKREGRVADSSGHLWILSKPTEALTAEQISDRLKQ